MSDTSHLSQQTILNEHRQSLSDVSSVFNLEVMSMVGRKHNEFFKGWNEIQRRNTTPVKSNNSKIS